MPSRQNIKIFYFNEVNVTKHWNVAGEVFPISDCLVHPALRSLPSQIWLPQEKKLSFSIFVVDACDIQYQCSK